MPKERGADGVAAVSDDKEPSSRRRDEGSLSIALFQAPGVAVDAYEATRRTLGAVQGFRLETVSPDQIRSGELGRFGVALFTGGRGSVQGKALGPDGRQRVREFVRQGGGYVGICAGAYMALQGEPEFHKIAIVAARHLTGDAWIRGIATVDVDPLDASSPVRLHYANGPLFKRVEVLGIGPYVPLALFRSDVSYPKHGTHAGEMAGTPAIIASSYEEGRVVLFSPNPALGAPTEPPRADLLISALRWASDRAPITPDLAYSDVLQRGASTGAGSVATAPQ